MLNLKSQIIYLEADDNKWAPCIEGKRLVGNPCKYFFITVEILKQEESSESGGYKLPGLDLLTWNASYYYEFTPTGLVQQIDVDVFTSNFGEVIFGIQSSCHGSANLMMI